MKSLEKVENQDKPMYSLLIWRSADLIKMVMVYHDHPKCSNVNVNFLKLDIHRDPKIPLKIT